jgi:hypothetical protein
MTKLDTHGTDLVKFGAGLTLQLIPGVALFGAAILPGQFLRGGLVPLLNHPTKTPRISDIHFGCEYSDYTPSDIGTMILVRRGGCSFIQKAEIAEWAGVIALIVIGTGLAAEFKTITMDYGDCDPHGVGLIGAMISIGDAGVILGEMGRRVARKAESSDGEDICDRGLCVPISIIGEIPPHDRDEVLNTKVLQFNNQPMYVLSLLII